MKTFLAAYPNITVQTADPSITAIDFNYIRNISTTKLSITVIKYHIINNTSSTAVLFTVTVCNTYPNITVSDTGLNQMIM